MSEKEASKDSIKSRVVKNKAKSMSSGKVKSTDKQVKGHLVFKSSGL